MSGFAGWYRVDVPHSQQPYVCAFELDDLGVIIKSAPIMRSWRGDRVQRFAKWARMYGGTFSRLP